MAFLDFTQPMAGPAPLAAVTATPAPADPAPAIATGFTAQEWQIVALARTDGLRSLNGPGRFVRLRRWIFGEETNLTLASDALDVGQGGENLCPHADIGNEVGYLLRICVVFGFQHGLAHPEHGERLHLSVADVSCHFECVSMATELCLAMDHVLDNAEFVFVPGKTLCVLKG